MCVGGGGGRVRRKKPPRIPADPTDRTALTAPKFSRRRLRAVGPGPLSASPRCAPSPCAALRPAAVRAAAVRADVCVCVRVCNSAPSQTLNLFAEAVLVEGRGGEGKKKKKRASFVCSGSGRGEKEGERGTEGERR